MKTFPQAILFFLIIVVACKKTSQSNSKPSFEFQIVNLPPEDFKIKKTNDTAIFNNQSYGSLQGEVIRFKNSNVSKIRAEATLLIGFLQYTNDDNPAFPISFKKLIGPMELKVQDSLIIIPTLYNKGEKSFFGLLGYEDELGLLAEIKKNSFDEIKSESLKNQHDFFNQILHNKDRYEECCKEYIDQATQFLKKDESEFNSFNELGLEMFCRQMKIQIHGTLKEGNDFNHTILVKDIDDEVFF